MKNPYKPITTIVNDIIVENESCDIKTFVTSFADGGDAATFDYLLGQFAELSVLGSGECPIGIASSPTEQGILMFTIKRAGVVTTMLHRAKIGDCIGVRGPYGNTYPFELMHNKNVLIISGGFAFTTLRSTIKYLLEPENRLHFKEISVIYGARNPGELLYKEDLWYWEKSDGLNMHITVDKGSNGWNRHEGFVPAILQEIAPNADDTIALVCGPPIMMKYTLPVLQELGFQADAIYLSLEMRMKCGIGKCGRCNIGNRYICTDGPVFSYAELLDLPQEF